MTKKIALYSLQTFSTTGGIQKMTRTLAHSLYLLSQSSGWDFDMWAMYDTESDLMPKYLPSENFKGYNSKRGVFVLNAIAAAAKSDVVILTHINLGVIGLAIKLINPKSRVWLIAHGIEVWRPQSLFKNMFLKRCDKVICVSNFTREQMISRHSLDPGICTVLNNAVDPFLKLPEAFDKPADLLARYNLTADNLIIFTLTRLASTEQYKGHDQVIKAVGQLKSKFPAIKYILSGKYDDKEEERIMQLIESCGVEENVILTGFIDEAELSDHFLLADMFVLPSKKEGFGIVFIEALACGLPVICGNADGSVDAINNGELGTAINVDNLDELENAIIEYLNTPLTESRRRYLQKQCLLHFNENEYMVKLGKLINE